MYWTESSGSQRGYAMAALLVSIGVLMVIMSAAMPVWRTQAKREKEAELIFRGEQYARAVNLYTRKMGPGNFPPSIDVLVQQHFLRKKYKDPMTEDGEFDIITAATAAGQPGIGGRGNQPGGRGSIGPVGPSTGLSAPPSSGRSGAGRGQAPSPFGGNQGSPFGQAGGGIMGVRSKSKESSFRVYNGATHYNEWSFLFANVSNRPGGGGAGRPGMPGRGGTPGPGGLPGGPVMSPPGGGRGPSGGRESNTPRGFGPGIGRGRG